MIPIYQKLIRPILFRLDAEIAHEQSVRLLGVVSKSKLLRKSIKSILGGHSNKQNCEVNCMGLHFPNRIGQAAGLDKDGRFPAISEALGFGHVEVGTVTPIPQSGNQKPRLFRLPESEALINRMGFNNMGVDSLVNRIQKTYSKNSRTIPLGINIGKGKETPIEQALDDYVSGYMAVADIADYVTINISSPNTADLRTLQKTTFLDPLLKGFRDIRLERQENTGKLTPPCLIKISPDEPFSLVEQIAGLITDYGFDGIIACNTSVHPPLEWNNKIIPNGGISGKPIGQKSNAVIKFIHRLTEGKLPIIGSGGIHDLESAQAKLDAGASLLQIYSSMVYRGPLWPSFLAKRIPLAKGW